MKTREHFDLHVGIPTTREVRASLGETKTTYIRQENQDYPYGVSNYPFGMDRPSQDIGPENVAGSVYAQLQVWGESGGFLSESIEGPFQPAIHCPCKAT